MTIEVIKNTEFDLQTFAGDTGSVTITNIPTDSQDYVAYMEIKGKETIKKSITLNGDNTCTFEFTANETASLGVGKFSYGIKICLNNGSVEDTYIPDLRLSNMANFIVYPERVAGTDNV